MLLLSHSELVELLLNKKQAFFDTADTLSFATYDTSIVWPYLYTYYPEHNEVAVFLYKNLLVCSVREDLWDLYRCCGWVVPFDSDQFKNDFLELLKVINYPLAYFPEPALLTKPISKFIQDEACHTSQIVNMVGNKSIIKRRSGIRRYTRNSGEYVVIPWPNHDKEKANELLDRWAKEKNDRRPSDGFAEDWPLRVLIDASVTTQKVICGKGVFLAHGDKYIAFGLGAQISNTRWAMLARISDCSYSYASDFVFHECAKLFKDILIESDGGGFDSNDSISYYKKSYCDPSLATQFYTVGRVMGDNL